MQHYHITFEPGVENYFKALLLLLKRVEGMELVSGELGPACGAEWAIEGPLRYIEQYDILRDDIMCRLDVMAR